jgi:hypothetical protein
MQAGKPSLTALGKMARISAIPSSVLTLPMQAFAGTTSALPMRRPACSTGADLRGCNFSEAAVDGATFRGANTEEANFTGASAYGYTFKSGEIPDW